MEDEQTEATRLPMTIKSVAVDTRLWMVNEAAKHGLTMAQWLDRVRATGGKPPEQPMVIPPNQPLMPRADPREALADAMAAAQVVETLARAGVAMDATAMRGALSLISARLREARGLPPTRPRIAREANGKTIPELDHE